MIAGIWFSLGIVASVLIVIAALVYLLLGVRYIPHRRVGIIEKLWSASGSLTEGRIIALNGEAGFQAKVLRGGLYPLSLLEIHHSQGALGNGGGGTHRLCLCAGWPAAAAGADAGPDRGVQWIPGLRGLP